jgi:hypothetical protein
MMEEKASTRQLKAAFRSHLAETKQHEKRAAEALKQLGEKASGKTCEVDAATGAADIVGRIAAGRRAPGAVRDPPVRQRVLSPPSDNLLLPTSGR